MPSEQTLMVSGEALREDYKLKYAILVGQNTTLRAHVAELEKQLSETGMTERVEELEKALKALRRVIPDYRAEVNAVEMADAALAVKEDADE